MAATDNRTAVQSNLHQQDLSKLDVTKLTAVSPEVISRQATINIGTIGHVAHGKSTVVKAISGVQTVRFKNELERNITIKLERLPEAVIESYKAADPVRKRKGSSRSSRAVKKRKTEKQKVDEYIVEDITGQMVIHGEQVFCVKWKGWSDDRNTWEPIENLDNCDKIIHKFITSQAELHSTQLKALKTELSFDRLLDASALESLWVLGRDRPQAVRENTLDLLALLNLSLAEEEWATALVLKARNSLREAKLAEMRASQLKALKDWETSVNITDKMGKIRVENTADLEGPPENFRYINENEPAEGVIIPDDPIMGCQCVSCHSKSNCDCAKLGGLFAYSSNKRLRVSIGTPIYECNRHCLCTSDCSNRVTQRGRMAKLCIFRTTTGCGWGVRAEQRIKEGQFVCEYVGEVMLSDEAERRSSTYDTWRSTYLFDLDFNPNVEATYTIDASQIGNISHFINHSCDPNLAVFAVWVNCLDPNMPHLCLFASRDIEPGEEISFDYLQKTGDNCGQTEEKEDCAIEDAKTPLKTSKCRCMSKNCRQFLFKMM